VKLGRVLTGPACHLGSRPPTTYKQKRNNAYGLILAVRIFTLKNPSNRKHYHCLGKREAGVTSIEDEKRTWTSIIEHAGLSCIFLDVNTQSWGDMRCSIDE
jgi:hypothetical protein